LRAFGVAAGAYALLSGALFNPTGFVKRLGVLGGSASQDWRGYSKDFAGVLANLRDTFGAQPYAFWPLPILIVVWLFAIVAIVRPPGESALSRRAPRALPLVAGLSSYVFFTLAVARSEHRFLLPLGLFLSAYGGVAGDLAFSAVRSARAQGVVALVLGGALGWAALRSFAVHLTQLGDARNAARTLLAHVPPGSRVETYGLLVYQPHFDVTPESPYELARVGPEPPGRRNPLVGAREVEDEIADVEERRPDVLVVTGGFANGFLGLSRDPARPLANVARARRREMDTVAFVHAATTGTLPNHRLVARLEPRLPGWARFLGLHPVSIQATTGMPLWVLVRTDGRARDLAPPSGSAPLTPPIRPESP
jgi:hypothetical protein